MCPRPLFVFLRLWVHRERSKGLVGLGHPNHSGDQDVPADN